MRKANITQLPSGSWRVRKMYDGELISFTVKSEKKPSDKEIDAMIQERVNGKTQSGRSTSFECSFNNYIKAKSNILSPATIRGYNSMYRNIPEKVKKTSVYDFNSNYCQRVINDYTLGHSAKSCKNMYGLIKIVVTFVRPEANIKVTLPKSIKKKEYTPSTEDIKNIFNLAKGSEYEIPLRLASYGVRRGEICALDISDLSEDNRLSITKDLVQEEGETWVLKEIPKTEDSYREIYIDDYLASLIREKGYYYKYFPNSINRALTRYQKELEIPHFRLHQLRHYFASVSHEMGISDADIMAMGGWKTDEVMKRVYREALEKNVSEGKVMFANMMSSL